MYYTIRPPYVDPSLFWTMDTFSDPVRSKYPFAIEHFFELYYTFPVES